MKTTILKLMYAMLLILIATFISCKGETGPAGADGKDGVDGQNGNANVISSAWVNPTWTVPATHASFDVTTSLITQEIADNGVILVYMKTSQAIYPLPISFTNVPNPNSFQFRVNVGSITIWFDAQDAYEPSSVQFRYVIIPASTSNKSANPQQEILYRLDKAGIDVNNYYQVMDYFGLE